MTFEGLKLYLYYLFCTASGGLLTLMAGGLGVSMYSGNSLYFWIAVIGYVVHTANLENPSIVVLTKELQEEQE